MAQVKVYGRRSAWAGVRDELSTQIHEALVGAWQMPRDKRFQRFLWLDDDDLVAPLRSERYLLIEVVAFAGRSRGARRALIGALYEQVCGPFDLPVDDLEIVLIEAPQESWGIRGVSGDELSLTYPVSI
ncbi:tautomerase family protein [Sanguibacter antarcticus]|uniref:Tautomerase-like protein n=1 Tax=Sanguibacter antarcticus TaxID=372484 RepID=A0A2A9E1Y2_9MICO|nr:tautomerase family protein [Sanguibacter antarcticus]PFG32854.1 tautomerase-like protein [Sanguibacter antarcticus]